MQKTMENLAKAFIGESRQEIDIRYILRLQKKKGMNNWLKFSLLLQIMKENMLNG